MTDPFGVFVAGFVGKLRAEADNLSAYGAGSCGSTCSKIASDLEAQFQAWWLTELPVSVAAAECGFSADRLRELCRDNEIPHQKGKGEKGHLSICRRDLPRKARRTEKSSPDAERQARDARLLAG